ncbi:MAG: hypothetical protein L0H96_06015 [Humibacillus sp.]|nr:hypothetical protein [Humibacillus sp.]MDN5776447.1 hypothetical protein [Humibacillus sp.]
MPAPNRDVIYTYRYLRAAIVVLLFMILFSVGYEWFWQWQDTGQSCFLGSISAYYYTPVRTVLVGSLCAIGVVLIVYKGHSPEEDVLLNFSGFMAVVVAMVPTVPDNLCGPSGFALSTSEIAMSVRNNIWTLIVAAVIAAVAASVLKRATVRRGVSSPPSTTTIWLSVICGAVLLFELVLFLVLRDSFIAISHDIAAATMVAGVIAVMVLSARGVDERHNGADTPYRRIYLCLALALGIMLALTLVVALTVGGLNHVVLVAEVVVIVLFATYWIVQTIELWDLSTSSPDEGRHCDGVAQ